MNASDIEILSTLKVKIESTQIKSQDNRPSPEIRKRAAQICGFLREFVTLRVAQFVLAHLSISMEPRVDHALPVSYLAWDQAPQRWKKAKNGVK